MLAGWVWLIWILFLSSSPQLSFGQEPPAQSREKGSILSQEPKREAASETTGPTGGTAEPVSGSEDEETDRDRRLHERLGPQPLTPEEQEEANRLSAIAARMGTDPTAIIGRVQTLFRYDALEGGSKTNNLVGRLDVPYHKNFLLRMDLPYVWTNPNQPDTSNQNGLSDLFVRGGGRVYTAPGYAVFAGMDFTFPTAEHAQLGSGKYTVGPGVATARVYPELGSIFYTLLQHQVSVGGDPSRQDVSISRFQGQFNTIWTERWWTQLEAVTQVDWERKAKNSMTLELEGGYRFTKDWGIWARPGVGLWGRNVPGAYEWNIEAGIRRTFSGF